jgi:hypothetical protein
MIALRSNTRIEADGGGLAGIVVDPAFKHPLRL